MKKIGLSLSAIAFVAVAALAQPTNNECTAPIVLTDVTNFCSNAGAFTNVDATPSSYGPATCFGTTQNDVWFTFTAQATDVTITVRGATQQSAGGTLQDPQVSLYFGTCGGTINQLECQAATGNNNVVDAYQGGLFVGSTYLIRIQGAGGQTGTFQICMNNYNAPVEPTSDCPSASILCDKSPFVVQSVTGAGSITTELDDATCFFNGSPVGNESNSTWFVWTCAQSGPLEFTLSPLNLPDDLDFVLYRLPNGVGNCNGKQVVRCMASGEFNFPSPCMGPTGLRPGETDVSEDAGCSDNGDNAWLAPFDMIAGESYALCVNNFTSTGNGFSIEFGGTGTFLGPEAAFTTLPPAVCLGIDVQIIDASNFPLGSITAWKWSFGADAVPQTATGPGPHTVAFNTPGINSVVLQLETDLGCKVTDIQTVIIFPDVDIDTLIAAPDCNGTANGTISINNIVSGTPPYLFSWNSGPFGTESSLDSLGVGIYTLTIRDSNNCESDFEIDVQERILTAEIVVDKPLCTGDANGVITLNVTNGVAPVQFDWGSGLQPNSSQGGFVAGNYTIFAVDNVLCEGVFNVAVLDNPPLTLTVDTTDISCFGANDGLVFANAGGGVGNFNYTWNNGQSEAEATNLGPGQFDITVTDGNGCSITSGAFIVEPGDVGIRLLDVLNLLCNGIPEGEIRVEGIDGVVPYTFSADGFTFFPSDTLNGLGAGTYQVVIRDANGCVDSVEATINQPPPVQVVVEPQDTTLDLGFSIQASTVTAPFGRPVTFEWTPANGLGCTTCPDPTVTAVNEQAYVVKVTDEDGCMATDTMIIRVNKRRPIYIPNVFNPETGTFPNDWFTLFGGPAAEQVAILRIYDRWGSLIFEKTNFALNEPNLGWDGLYKGEKMFGVFAYYASVRFVDQVEVKFEGDVTVVR